MTPTTSAASYRALLGVPQLPRVLLGMQLSRIAQMMTGVAIVLFTLQVYGSPEIAGLVTFVSIFPGLLISPIAGALLDRHGRARLVVLDYLVAMASMVLIGSLALAGALPPWLLVVIAFVSSFTGPLSNVGLRTLLPIMVPSHLWERVNAIDSNGYVVATIIGPPVAAAMVQLVGGPTTIIGIGLVYGAAAIVLVRIKDPSTRIASSGRLLRDAWDGLVYTWHNRTLRAIGFFLSILNLSGGILSIVIPLIVLDRLGMNESVVGILFMLQGLGGMVTAFLFGRMDSRGREKALMAWPTLGMALSLFLLLPDAGIVPVALCLIAGGMLNGPMDIGMFTIRQRRTDPAWMGRAFAVSMSFNFAGFPIGAWVGGSIAAVSIDGAVWVGIVAASIATVLAFVLVPARDTEFEKPASAAEGADEAAALAAAREADEVAITEAPWGEAAGSGAAGAIALHRLHDERGQAGPEQGGADEPQGLGV